MIFCGIRGQIMEAAMKELKSDLSKVKVGDWVCTAQVGWCKVLDVGIGDDYDITIRAGGCFYNSDEYPTCFPADQVPEEYLAIFGPPPVEFKDGEPVWVGNSKERWYLTVFKKYENGKYWTYGYDSNYIPWEHCNKLEKGLL